MKILIEKECYRRMRGFTKLAKGEVAGLARVTTKNGKFYVHDLKLFMEQVVTGASVKVTTEMLLTFLSSVENPQEFKFMWHSHANMGAFLSGTDEGCISDMLETSNFLISCVTNKKEDIYLRLDIMVDKIQIKIETDYIIEGENDFEQYKAEFESHIKDKPPDLYSFSVGYSGQNKYMVKDGKIMPIKPTVINFFDKDDKFDDFVNKRFIEEMEKKNKKPKKAEEIKPELFNTINDLFEDVNDEEKIETYMGDDSILGCVKCAYQIYLGNGYKEDDLCPACQEGTLLLVQNIE